MKKTWSEMSGWEKATRMLGVLMHIAGVAMMYYATLACTALWLIDNWGKLTNCVKRCLTSIRHIYKVQKSKDSTESINE